MKNKIIGIVAAIIMILIGGYSLAKCVNHYVMTTTSMFRIREVGKLSESPIGNITDTSYIMQEFEIPYDYFKGISIKIKSDNVSYTKNLVINLVLNDDTYEWDMKKIVYTDDDKGEGSFDLFPDKSVYVGKGAKGILTVSIKDTKLNGTASMYAAISDSTSNILSYGDTQILGYSVIGNIFGSNVPDFKYLHVFFTFIFGIIAVIIINLVMSPTLEDINIYDYIIGGGTYTVFNPYDITVWRYTRCNKLGKAGRRVYCTGQDTGLL